MIDMVRRVEKFKMKNLSQPYPNINMTRGKENEVD